MRLHKILFLISIICFTPIASLAKVRMFLSAALVDAHFDFRKQQYIKSFSILAQYGYGYDNVYVVESVKKHGPTFLDTYSNNVFYATVNNPNAKDHGINEAKTMLEASYHFNFDPEDIIIKLTGRHHFISDRFVRLVEKNQDFDAIAKIHPWGAMATTCFSMKYKHFQEMFENLDYRPRNWVNLEAAVGKYMAQKMKDPNFKVLNVDKLGVKTVLLGSTTAPGSTGVAIQ